jgi:hypothetical protein
MTNWLIGLYLGGLGLLISLLGIVYWLNTGSGAVLGLLGTFLYMAFFSSLGVHSCQYCDHCLAPWRVTACA